MEFEFDEAKNVRNIRERGLDFNRLHEMDLATAVSFEDTRSDYGEKRITLIGHIDGRLHIAIVTYRNGRTRVISLRRANLRESRTHEKATHAS